ncbi:TPA: hypothetical protein DF272_02490 [Candidatus Falkowbacteria bacterium]|nr:hypothetical protein [Candidatus Falkowbacteria bacterium]
MDLSTIGFTLQTLGEVIIALTVLSVHRRLRHERKIDKKVSESVETEQIFGVMSIILIIVGFILQVYA